jgi:hypothetical protein
VLGGDQLDHVVDIVEGALVAVQVAAGAAAATGAAAVGPIDFHPVAVEVALLQLLCGFRLAS